MEWSLAVATSLLPSAELATAVQLYDPGTPRAVQVAPALDDV